MQLDIVAFGYQSLWKQQGRYTPAQSGGTEHLIHTETNQKTLEALKTAMGSAPALTFPDKGF